MPGLMRELKNLRRGPGMSSVIQAAHDPRGHLGIWEDGEPDGRLDAHREALLRFWGVDIDDPDATMPEPKEDAAEIIGQRDILTKYHVTPGGLLEFQDIAKSGSVYIVAKTDADRAKLAIWAEELGAEVCGA